MTTSTPLLRWTPERLFLVFGSLWGLLLVALIPPVAGGNETYNFGRAVSIATGTWTIRTAEVPKGINTLVDVTWRRFPPGSRPPFSYAMEDWRQAAAVGLSKEHATRVPPNPIAVLHPFAYGIQAPVISLGITIGLPPLALLYLGRLSGLAVGLLLVALAIRAMPVGKSALATIALLPTITFGRSTLDADQLTNGFAFLFVALVLREAVATGPVSRRRLVALASLATVLAPAKSAYLLLPLFAIAIPTRRFPFRAAWVGAIAFIVVPGIVLSLLWLLSLSHGPMQGISYTTWAGSVTPSLQQQYILEHPATYVVTLLRTLLMTPLVPNAFLEILGVFGPPVRLPAAAYPFLAAILFVALVGRDEPSTLPIHSKWLAAILAGLTVVIILTLLYMQWNSVGASTVEGFQGRYLYPVVPLLLCLLPPSRPKVMRRWGTPVVMVMAVLSGSLTLWTVWATYWA